MPETTVVIREMRLEDAETAAELAHQLGYERTAEQIRAWLSALHADHRAQAAFVACVDDQVAGWIDVSVHHHLQSEPYALIGGLVVDEHFRGRNIGQKLCRHAEEWAWAHGLKTIRVTSRSTRTDAHRFYLRDGYQTLKTSLVFEKNRP